MNRLSLFIVLMVVPVLKSFSQNEKAVSAYLNKIRNNEAALTAFFHQMPKGGDLHHHYSGSLYAETYVKHVIEKNYWLNKNTLLVTADSAVTIGDNSWTRFDLLKTDGSLAEYKELLLRKWSIKDYRFGEIPPDKHFFDSFNYFGSALVAFNSNNLSIYKNGLNELKQRAKAENVQYIETMFGSVSCNKDFSKLIKYDSILRIIQQGSNADAVHDTLNNFYNSLIDLKIDECATNFAQLLKRLHKEAALDDTAFTIRYLTQVNRLLTPTIFFTKLVAAFIAASQDSLIVGINILAPEHYEMAMNDYWLHMRMFRYCKEVFPAVKTSMHAGELALAMVAPEELTWHINEAVRIAKANRIGHGVDLPYEKNAYALLNYMRNNRVAIEINLASNEFILNIKNGRHPVTLYHESNVPIVMATDDAGVLRTSLTEQFVLLAHRYKTITYQNIKRFVYNSIEYSFIEDETIKRRITKDLDKQFAIFEQKVIQYLH